MNQVIVKKRGLFFLCFLFGALLLDAQQKKQPVEVRARTQASSMTIVYQQKKGVPQEQNLAQIPDSLFVKKEFRLKKKSGKLSLKLSNVTIEGYEGSEIIFSTKVLQEEADEKANGLVLLSASGAEDNTGLGIHVTENGELVEVKQISKRNQDEVLIKVPKGMNIQYDFNKSVYNADDLTLKNIENEVEVSMMYGNVKMENVTGPLTVKTIYGSIDVKFGKIVKGPVSLVSVYGSIDISMANDSKSNVNLSTDWGQIYAAKEMNIEMEKTEENKDRGENIKGKMNGGGFDLILKTNYGKIYIRKI